MADLEINTDPASYISGPTGNMTSRTNGGTNRSGGITVVDVQEEAGTTQTGETPSVGESTPAPAPAQTEQPNQQQTQQAPQQQ